MGYRTRSMFRACFAMGVVLLALAALADEAASPLRLTISANKESYLVAEPIALEIAVVHASPVTAVKVQGPVLKTRFGSLDIYIAQNGQDEVNFWRGVHSDRIIGMRTLEYGDRIAYVEILAYNATTKSFVLATPGEYRIRAEYPSLGLTSNELLIHASTAEAPLLPYAEKFQQLEVAKYIEFDSIGTDEPARIIDPCVDFVGDGPGNIYQHYIAAYLGCLYARRETVEDATVALRYLEPVLQATDETFPARKELLYFSGSCYAGTGRYAEAVRNIRKLKEEFPDSNLAKKIRDEEIAFLEQKAAEAKQ